MADELRGFLELAREYPSYVALVLSVVANVAQWRRSRADTDGFITTIKGFTGMIRTEMKNGG